MDGPPQSIRVFISHSNADNVFVADLVRDLRQALDSYDAVWVDSYKGLMGGDSWWSTIMREIKARNVFLVILSPDAMESRWVEAETTIAWQQKLSQKNTKKLIVPVLYHPCAIRDDLNTLQIISFVAPRPYREALDELLLALQQSASPPSSIALKQSEPLSPVRNVVWNVPSRRNPFFTGRESVLVQLRDNLTRHRTTALTQAQAISGLGGIGKTQIAVEYAYRYREHYHYVLWLQAITLSELLTDFARIAQLLNLPFQNMVDQRQSATIMKKWLEEHGEWLLIFDNADDLTLIIDYLPQCAHGHILLTTRAQTTGMLAEPLEVEKMDIHEGALLLLRRAKLLKQDFIEASIQDSTQQKSWSDAETIVRELDGLPLAIDQAGAYIEETRCSLMTYLDLYQTHRKALLLRRSTMPSDHPEPVATTWKLSFQEVAQVNPAAADLLRFCSFLDPAAIPEELLVKGAAQLGPELGAVAVDPFLLNKAIEDLFKYSLIRRNTDNRLLSMHRLVQVVLKDEMDDATQRKWAERVIRAIVQALPPVKIANTIQQWQLYLPHIYICAAFIVQYTFTFEVAASLLHQTAYVLRRGAFYHEAELLQMQALTIREQVLGPEHPDTAASVAHMATLYRYQGRYSDAEPLYQRALAIREQVLGPEHPDTASTLSDLGTLYRFQGRYIEVEPLYQRALAIRKQMLGPEHPDTADSFHNLARLYVHQGRYTEAESFIQQSLTIREKVLGPEHPHTATSLHNLARFYKAQGNYAEAERVYLQALAIREKTQGPEHHHTAITLSELAKLYYDQGNYAEAERLYQRALAIYEKILGHDHPHTVVVQRDYSMLQQAMVSDKRPHNASGELHE